MAQPHNAYRKILTTAIFFSTLLTLTHSSSAQLDEADAPVIQLRGKVIVPEGIDPRELTCELVERTKRQFDFEVTSIKLKDDLTFVTQTKGLTYRSVIVVRSLDRKWRGAWSCSRFELHSKSKEEIELTLEPVNLRPIQVTYDSKPQAGATVFIEDALCVEPMTTDRDGIVWVDTLDSGKNVSAVATDHDRLVSILWYGDFPSDGSPFLVTLKRWEQGAVQVVGVDGKPVADLQFACCSIGSDKQNTSDLRRSFCARSGPDGITAPILFSEERMHFEVFTPNMRFVSFDKSTTPHKVIVAPVQPNVEVRGKLRLPDGIGSGLLLSGLSFQNEAPNHSSSFDCRVNADGTFVASVHPEYTYCVYIQDAKWVTAPWTGIMSSAKSDIAKPVELDIVEGEKVEVLVTRGKDFAPYAGVWVSFTQYHSFSWMEDGVEQLGTGGPDWPVCTDEEGFASVCLGPGAMEIFVSDDNWSYKKGTNVLSGTPTVLTVHRDEPESIAFSGQVKIADAVETNIALSQISIDLYLHDVYKPTAKLIVDNDGRFKGIAAKPRIALLARTKDAQYSGVLVVDLESNKATPLNLELHRSVSLFGRVVDPDGFALADARLEFGTQPAIHWPVKEPFGSNIFHTENLFVTTDRQGKYRFENVCSGVPSAMFANYRDGDAKTVLYEQMLEPPTALVPTIVMPEVNMNSRSIEARIKNRVDSSRLINSNTLLVFHGSDKAAVEMAKGLLARSTVKSTRDLSPLVISDSTVAENPSNSAWLKEQGWILSNTQELLLVLFDQTGKPIFNKRIQASDDILSIGDVIESTQLQLAEQSWDAQTRFDKALKLARRTNRDVWISFVSTRHPASIALLRWQNENRKELEKHFVLMPIDWFRDKDAKVIAERYSIPLDQDTGLFSVLVNKEGVLLEDTSGESPYGQMRPSEFIDRERMGKLMKAASLPMDEVQRKELVDSM
ncbi:MAG: hypothetical protein NTY15_09460 [Planctomycetota bacterium]|nr:hypothetical protein [Planctomycetota bacterium]